MTARTSPSTGSSGIRSKEISKSNVVDDMVLSNGLLFEKRGDKPDHCVVIKYVPFVGDSKRAMDEYISSIFMNGSNTIALHNTCEDSLLAAPIIIDLIVLTELFSRVMYLDENKSWQTMDAILTLLSFLTKVCAYKCFSWELEQMFSCICYLMRGL